MFIFSVGVSLHMTPCTSLHVRYFAQMFMDEYIAVRSFEYLIKKWAIYWGSGLYLGERGWRSGESIRLPQMWPGFDSRSRCHMWVEFVVGSRPCSEGFSPGTPVFLPP